jgi:uncharacterized membrane protein
MNSELILRLVAQSLHNLSAVVWVGGMFFAYMALRPAAATLLDPPMRLPLWYGTFSRFFPWVWLAVAILLVTGFWMMFSNFGGWQSPPYIHMMLGIGIVMMLIYFHVYFAPYRRLRRAVEAQDWPAGGRALAQIRMLVGINLLLGVVVVALGAGGRFL